MNDTNSVLLIGRLTKDSEVRYTRNGSAVSSFSIAVNRRRKSGEQWIDEVSYFEINLYGKAAENLAQYLIKGRQVAVNGELRQDRWTNGEGKAKSKVFIVADSIQLLASPADSQQGPKQQNQQQNYQHDYKSQSKKEFFQSSYEDEQSYDEQPDLMEGGVF